MDENSLYAHTRAHEQHYSTQRQAHQQQRPPTSAGLTLRLGHSSSSAATTHTVTCVQMAIPDTTCSEDSQRTTAAPDVTCVTSSASSMAERTESTDTPRTAIEMSKHSGNIDTSVQMKTIETSEQRDTVEMSSEQRGSIEMSRHHGSLEASEEWKTIDMSQQQRSIETNEQRKTIETSSLQQGNIEMSEVCDVGAVHRSSGPATFDVRMKSKKASILQRLSAGLPFSMFVCLSVCVICFTAWPQMWKIWNSRNLENCGDFVQSQAKIATNRILSRHTVSRVKSALKYTVSRKSNPLDIIQ